MTVVLMLMVVVEVVHGHKCVSSLRNGYLLCQDWICGYLFSLYACTHVRGVVCILPSRRVATFQLEEEG